MTALDHIEATTLGDLVVRGAARYGDADAIVFPEDRRTYTELLEGSIRAARSLRALGVEPGDHVGILMANCIDYAEVMFGTAMLGGVAVLLNARYRGAGTALRRRERRPQGPGHERHRRGTRRSRRAPPRRLPGVAGRSRRARSCVGRRPEAAVDRAPGPPDDDNLVDRDAFEAAAETVDEEEVHRLRARSPSGTSA
jgi:fatty-acyl-CoA synthase